MPPLGPSQPSSFLDLSIFNGLFPQEGAKVIPAVLNFALQQTYNLDFTQLQAQKFIKILQSVFVDNSLSASPLTITVLSTNQKIEIPANSQAIVPLFIYGNFTFTVNSAGGVVVPIFFTNVPMPAAVWSVSGAPVITGGLLQVQDPALEALISNGALQILLNGTGNNNTVKPFFVADELFTGNTTTTAAQTIITGSPSYFITDVTVAVSGDATVTGGAELSVLLKDGATTIAQGYADLASTPIPSLAPAKLIELRSIQYNSKGNAAALTLTLGSVLATGKVYWNIAGGLCTNIGP